MAAILGLPSHLEVMWELPEVAAFLDRLPSFRRVIMFDKGGTGRSLAAVLFTDIVGSTHTAGRLGDRRWRPLELSGSGGFRFPGGEPARCLARVSPHGIAASWPWSLRGGALRL